MHSRRDRLDARLDILDPLVLDGDALARSTGAAPAEFVDDSGIEVRAPELGEPGSNDSLVLLDRHK
jgi:hypothetical protein